MNEFEIKDGILVKYTGKETAVTIPDSVTSIGRQAFAWFKSLQSITIPDSVTSIGTSAFYDCKSLQSITIPDSVTSIGVAAFYGCSSLTSITIPDSVTSIGRDTFEWCTSLQSITIPNSVTSIGNWAFHNCNSLQSITIPDSVTSIGFNAFYGCASLQSVTVTGKLPKISQDVFIGCEKLQSILSPKTPIETWASSETKRAAVFGYLQNRELFLEAEITAGYKKYAVGQRKKLLLAIFKNDAVAALAFYAEEKKITAKNFEEEYLKLAQTAKATECVAYLLDWQNKNISLEDIEKKFEKELNKDPYNAEDMKKLWSYEKLEDGTLCLTSYKGAETNVTVPPYIGKTAVSRLGDCIFSSDTVSGSSKPQKIRENLEKIESVVIGDNITSIGFKAFYGCACLQSITIPTSVTSIGSGAFKDCTSLQSIISPKVPFETWDSSELKRGAAFGYLQNRELFLDADIVTAYKKYAVAQRKKLLPVIFKHDAVAALAFYAEEKKITAKNFEEDYLKPAKEANAEACVAFLLNFCDNNMK